MLKNKLTETRAQKLASEAHCCDLETQLMIERDSFAESIANLETQKGIIESRVSVLRVQLLEERGFWKKSIAELGEQLCKTEKSVKLRIRDLEAQRQETDEALIDADYSIDLAAKLITDLSSENAAKESEICYLRAQIVQKEHSEANKDARKPKPMKSSMLAGSLLNRAADGKQRYNLNMRQTRSEPPQPHPHPPGYQTTLNFRFPDRYPRSNPRKRCFS